MKINFWQAVSGFFFLGNHPNVWALTHIIYLLGWFIHIKLFCPKRPLRCVTCVTRRRQRMMKGLFGGCRKGQNPQLGEPQLSSKVQTLKKNNHPITTMEIIYLKLSQCKKMYVKLCPSTVRSSDRVKSNLMIFIPVRGHLYPCVPPPNPTAFKCIRLTRMECSSLDPSTLMGSLTWTWSYPRWVHRKELLRLLSEAPMKKIWVVYSKWVSSSSPPSGWTFDKLKYCI